MAALRIYTEDLDTAKAILKRNGAVTRQFFYKQCYPLFKSIYDNYYTDCETCLDFMNEIYTLVLTPSAESGRCQLENYRGESTLTSWLKVVCLYYCYGRFKKRNRMPIVPVSALQKEDEEDAGDRILDKGASSTIDISAMEREDVETILALMPNERYRSIIRYRYLEDMSHEEIAKLLGMRMEIYYNKHKLAKAQYTKICRKEVGDD